MPKLYSARAVSESFCTHDDMCNQKSQHSQKCKDPTLAPVLVLMTLTFNPKIHGFSGLIVEHFYVKFGDRSCIGF